MAAWLPASDAQQHEHRCLVPCGQEAAGRHLPFHVFHVQKPARTVLLPHLYVVPQIFPHGSWNGLSYHCEDEGR